ncbi:MAG: ABC transporter permease [Lachnospiraceae bacterium]|nr:ABC transporter permease [Lachnospiraceae bacterium]
MNGKKLINRYIQSKSTIMVFVILLVFSSIVFADKNFFSILSLQNLVKKGASEGGFLALGMTFVILLGQIDLSVGSVLALSGVVMAMFGNENPLLGILLGLAVGLACGFVNGLMVAKMKISSWVATLAMMLGIRGVVLLITSQKAVSLTNSTLVYFSGGKVLGISSIIWLLLILTLICMYISRNTRLGMGLYAVGGNEEAARMMGLKVDAIKIAAYTFCGLFAAIAGMVLASKLYTAQPTAGDSWETTAIAMCALGSVKLSGGEGRFSGTFFGILIIAVINTIFNYAGSLNSWWQNIIMGVLILISIGLQSQVIHLPSGSKNRMEQGGSTI